MKILNSSSFRNFGHQRAITAGLNYCSGAAAVIIDADLQDPPEEIENLVNKWKQGFDVIHAVRSKEKENLTLKRFLPTLSIEL